MISKEKLEHMNAGQIVRAIAGLNKESAKALEAIAHAASQIDPAYPAEQGELNPDYIKTVAGLDIYGPKADILLNDVCHNDPQLAATILRANILGILPEAQLNTELRAVVNGKKRGLNLSAIAQKVQETIPGYKPVVRATIDQAASSTISRLWHRLQR